MPTTVTWRGIITDPTTAKYLTAVAAEVTVMCKAAGVADFTVTPIGGCGSYQTTTAASAGTHAGGGAVDINAEGLTDRQARILESAARKWGGTAWFRPRTSPTGFVYGWQRHVHVLRSDCADLSTAARTQVGQYRRGLNGLADNGPDTGDRSWVSVAWGAVKGVASTVSTIGGTVADHTTAPTPAPAPTIQEDDMAQQVTIAGGTPSIWHPIVVPNDGKKYQVALAFAGGATSRSIEMLVFGRVATVQTASKMSRNMKWDWQRDVPGVITLNKGEGNVSIRWNGTADQSLAIAIYPVGTL